MPGDAVKIAPNAYKVVFENDRVRVLESRMSPGSKSEMHSHPAVVGIGVIAGKYRFINRCVNDIRRRPSQPLIQWRFHPHSVHRGRRLRSTQGPSDA